MKKVLIMGFGEVGRGLYGIYNSLGGIKVVLKDPKLGEEFEDKRVMENEKVDVLNVCIPYTRLFISSVVKAVKVYKPLLTLIHSTVPVGTTYKVYKRSGNNVIHTPIIGVHPHLTESIKTFRKIVGGVNADSTKLAIEHFKEIGLTPFVMKNSDESEMSKLLSTTYYAWNIIYMKEVYKICKEFGLTFENVYEKLNEIYNEGYIKMGKSNVVRPVLKYMPGEIGGHCLKPNMEILKKIFYPANLLLELDDE
jgi:UDP-N-acetyl-D-mannosaminuronate dehydrogenase